MNSPIDTISEVTLTVQDVQELEKEGEIGEDESKGGQEKVEDLTKSYVGKIDTLSKTKETDIMDV